MESNRDLTITALNAANTKKYFDAHSATGAKAIRAGNETKINLEVFANDWSKDALDYIEKNKQINNLKNVKILNQDTRVVLYNRNFDFIDLDPFGSPVPFFDSSIDSIVDNGILAFTATDTAPLCGSHIKVGLRRYGARTLRTSYHKEIGLRVLVGKAIRDGAEKDKALKPLLCYYQNHFFRVYLKNKEGAQESNKLLEKIGFIQHCFNCGKRKLVQGLAPNLKEKCECGSHFKNAGPLFLGKLYKKSFLQKMISEIKNLALGTKKKSTKLLKNCLSEADLPPTFYDVHKICKRLSISAPKTSLILEKLREKGYIAVKTHFDSLGIKTNADVREMNRIIKEINSK